MKKNVKMAFDVSALPAYINQNSDELLMEANYGFKTGSLVSIQEGIKLTDALQYLEVTPTRQAGACSLTAAGDAVFEQKTITVANIAYKISLCMEDLIPKWTQRALPNGSNQEDEVFTFGEEITSNMLEKIAQDNENAVWFGTAGAGTFDGFGTLITAATVAAVVGDTPVVGNTSGTTAAAGITNANAFGLVQDMADAVPAALKGNPELICFLGYDDFDKYRRNLIDLNLFHESSIEGYNAVIPYTGITIAGVPGLNGTSRMFLGKKSNFVLGSDMMNDYEQAKSWFDEDTDLTNVQVKFKMGAQMKFFPEVVQFTLVP